MPFAYGPIDLSSPEFNLIRPAIALSSLANSILQLSSIPDRTMPPGLRGKRVFSLARNNLFAPSASVCLVCTPQLTTVIPGLDPPPGRRSLAVAPQAFLVDLIFPG